MIERFNPQKLAYVDESGIDSYISREYGGELRGKKITGELSGKRYARESFVAGLLGKEVIAPICYQGTMETTLFNDWLENLLLPSLDFRFVIIVDNVPFNKLDKI